jgi:predicted RNase H-like HicB family nuclease
MHPTLMENAATFTARIVRDGKWFIAFSPEFPEGNGQGLTEEEALESLRGSILLLLEDRREDARACLGTGEKLTDGVTSRRAILGFHLRPGHRANCGVLASRRDSEAAIMKRVPGAPCAEVAHQ